MFDQIATFVLRFVGWLILLGSLVIAVGNVVAVTSAANSMDHVLAASSSLASSDMPSLTGPVFGLSVFFSLLYLFGGVVAWAFFNVIASIADNLMALKDSNDNLVSLARLQPSAYVAAPAVPQSPQAPAPASNTTNFHSWI